MKKHAVMGTYSGSPARAGTYKTPDWRQWQKLTDEVLAVRKKALNNRKVAHAYTELLKTLYSRKKSGVDIWKEFVKIRNKLQEGILFHLA